MPFEQDFSARISGDYKFTSFANEHSKNEDLNVTYSTNNPVNIGVGVSWKNFSIGFSQGFSFMRFPRRGKTSSTQFDYHGYGRKFVYDIFFMRHKGFHNIEREDGNRDYPYYGDLRLSMYGGSLQYVFNNKRFSYSAAFNQNQRQIKSAGTFLVGGSVYYSKVRSDSTIIFDKMSTHHQNLQFGVSGGYAYSWVINKNWFLMGSFAGGLNIGNNYPSRFFKEKIEVYPTMNLRIALGYNSDSWSAGASFNINRTYLFFDGKEDLLMNNGIVRVSLIKRFDWGNKAVNKALNMTKKKLRM